MVDKQPLVSIAVICYQNEAFLHECIESILNQTYTSVEIIIADDGSTDNSAEIIKSYASSHENISCILSPVNKGISNNLNLALELCRGPYICMIAGDDVMYSHKIEKQVEFLELNKDFSLCFHNVDVFDNSANTVIYRWLDKYLPGRNAKDALFIANWFFKTRQRKMPSGSWFGRASYIKKGTNDDRIPSYHEFIFVLGMHAAAPEAKWHCLPEVLGVYRVHGASLSNRQRSWPDHAEEVSINYALAAVKYPHFDRQIRNEAAYWWFVQLLYDQVPKEHAKDYLMKFIRNYGMIKYMYLILCKILLSKALSPLRKILK